MVTNSFQIIEIIKYINICIDKKKSFNFFFVNYFICLYKIK